MPPRQKRASKKPEKRERPQRAREKARDFKSGNAQNNKLESWQKWWRLIGSGKIKSFIEFELFSKIKVLSLSLSRILIFFKISIDYCELEHLAMKFNLKVITIAHEKITKLFSFFENNKKNIVLSPEEKTNISGVEGSRYVEDD